MAATKSQTRKTPAKSDAADDLRSLFEDQLKDIYWAEKALTKALPKMAKNATAPELIDALNEHLEVTKSQVQGVERVFEILGKKPQAKKCPAMEGLIEEGEEIVSETVAGPVRDAGIICSCQKVEHYEIASYGSLATFAHLLGEEEAAEILEEILAEEKDADQTLTGVAESSINLEALEGEEDEEEEEETPTKKSSSTKKATKSAKNKSAKKKGK